MGTPVKVRIQKLKSRFMVKSWTKVGQKLDKRGPRTYVEQTFGVKKLVKR